MKTKTTHPGWHTLHVMALVAIVAVCTDAAASGEDPYHNLEASYATAGRLLTTVTDKLQRGADRDDISEAYTVAMQMLRKLAVASTTDTANRARCAALLVPLLTNQSFGYRTALVLRELPPDYLDAYHAVLRTALSTVSFAEDAYMEDVLCVYAMLPSCDVAFATNKAQEIKDRPFIRDAILARHGDQAALQRLLEIARTCHRGMNESYLARVLALVRTTPMVEFLVAGLRDDRVIYAGSVGEMRMCDMYENALRAMFRYEPGFPGSGTFLDIENWCIEMFDLTLPADRKERVPRPAGSPILIFISPAAPGDTNTVSPEQ